MKIKFLRLILVIALLMPFVAAAQNPCTSTPGPGNGGNLGRCVSQIYLWSLGLSAVLAVSVCVWGGYLVMTARGNAAQASNGKSYVYSAIMGMVILFGAYIILNTINPDLTDLTTPSLNTIETPVPTVP